MVDLADQLAAATAVQTAMERSVLVGVSDLSYTSQTALPLMVQAPSLPLRLDENEAVMRHKQKQHIGSIKALSGAIVNGSEPAQQSKKRPGKINTLRDRNGRFMKSLQRSPPPPPRGKPLSMFCNKGSSTKSSLTQPPHIEQPPLIKLPTPSELVSIIYKCCILPCIMYKSSSNHAKSCRKHLFFTHIQPQLIHYFANAPKSGISYKRIDAHFANALHILGF